MVKKTDISRGRGLTTLSLFFLLTAALFLYTAPAARAVDLDVIGGGGYGGAGGTGGSAGTGVGAAPGASGANGRGGMNGWHTSPPTSQTGTPGGISGGASTNQSYSPNPGGNSPSTDGGTATYNTNGNEIVDNIHIRAGEGGTGGGGGTNGTGTGAGYGSLGGNGTQGGRTIMVININDLVEVSGTGVVIRGGNGGNGGNNGSASGGTGGAGGTATLTVQGNLITPKITLENGTAGASGSGGVSGGQGGVARLNVDGTLRAVDFDGKSGVFHITNTGVAILGKDDSSWDSTQPGNNYAIPALGWVQHQLTVAGFPSGYLGTKNGVLAYMGYNNTVTPLDLRFVSLGVGTGPVAPGNGGMFGNNSLTVVNSSGFINTGIPAILINAGNNNPFAAGGSDSATLLVVVDQNIKTTDSFQILGNAGSTAFDLSTGNLGWTKDGNASTTSRLLTLDVSASGSTLTASFGAANPMQTLPGVSASVANLLTASATQVGHSIGWDPNVSSAPHSGVHFVSRAADSLYMPSAHDGARTIEGAVRLATVGGIQAAVLSTHTSAAKIVHDRALDTGASDNGDGTSGFMASGFNNSGISALAAGGAFDQGAPSHITNMIANYNRVMEATRKQSLAAAYSGDISSSGGAYNHGFGLWVTPVYQDTRITDLRAGNFETGYDGRFYGAVIGADYTTRNKMRFGLAVNFGKGEVDSRGAFNPTENDFKYAGVSLYGGWNIGNVTISGDVAYTRNSNDIVQSIPTSMLYPDIYTDADADIWAVGVKGQYRFATPYVDITPYAAVRYMYLTTDDYMVYTNTYYSPGSTGNVFYVEKDRQHIWRAPIGVQLAKVFSLPDQFRIIPSVDVGVVFSGGNLDATSITHIPGVVAASVTTTEDVIDRVTFDGRVGLEMIWRNLAFALNYNLQASQHRTGQTVFGTVRLDF